MLDRAHDPALLTLWRDIASLGLSVAQVQAALWPHGLPGARTDWLVAYV